MAAIEDRDGIRWPEEFSPAEAPVHVHNELAMSAPPEAVWAWLVRAGSWPSWYPNSREVRIDGDGAQLAPGVHFRWRTFGVAIESRVLEFVPGERIGWDARGLGVRAYHAWLLRRTPGGCHVETEETQHGWLARLGHLLMPHRMQRGHQVWLDALHAKALGGPPQP
jgi:uncharacterized protein YndB with AHSA1/START domain